MTSYLDLARAISGTQGAVDPGRTDPAPTPVRKIRSSSVGALAAGPVAREGYFEPGSNRSDAVRLKLPTIINRCRTYAVPLAEILGIDAPRERTPDGQGTRRAVDAFRRWGFEKDRSALASCVASAAADLAAELQARSGDEIPQYALAAAAGQLAADAGLEGWERSVPLLAAYDYLEVLHHAQWATECRVEAPLAPGAAIIKEVEP